MTKRKHMKSYNPTPLKQKVTSSGRAVDEDNKVYEYSTEGVKGSSSAGAILNKAKGGEQFKGSDADYFKTLSGRGATGQELADKGYIHPSKIGDYDKLYPTGSGTPGEFDLKKKPVMKTVPGGTVDTSTAYGVRQIGRGQKKAAKDVRRADIKMAKLKAKGFDPESGTFDESKVLKGKAKRQAIKQARIAAKGKEVAFESKAMGNTAKRIGDMASSGVDPTLTARYEFGRGMQSGGTTQVTDITGSLPTLSSIEQEGKEKFGVPMLKKPGAFKMKGYKK